jgi:beta-aspartyl-peptidase (threonine type)
MTEPQAAIIVHGGAGQISAGDLPSRLQGCKQAAVAGWKILESGGSALDAVEAAVISLEDNPLFNAGIGSTLNALGQVEMDAAIMDGSTISAGAVAAVSGIKNPIHLARKVLEDGRHIVLAGAGALRFAREAGVPEYPPEFLVIDEQRLRWQKKHGTVGCVALDRGGRITAGTSTGGIFDKLPGRVGDSPLIGCGTYADSLGGVSCTGDGEAIIRVVMAKTALEFVRSDCHPSEAARRAVAELEEKTGGSAGLIIIDHRGRVGYSRNTSRMPVSIITGAGEISTES